MRTTKLAYMIDYMFDVSEEYIHPLAVNMGVLECQKNDAMKEYGFRFLFFAQGPYSEQIPADLWFLYRIVDLINFDKKDTSIILGGCNRGEMIGEIEKIEDPLELKIIKNSVDTIKNDLHNEKTLLARWEEDMKKYNIKF